MTICKERVREKKRRTFGIYLFIAMEHPVGLVWSWISKFFYRFIGVNDGIENVEHFPFVRYKLKSSWCIVELHSATKRCWEAALSKRNAILCWKKHRWRCITVERYGKLYMDIRVKISWCLSGIRVWKLLT